MKQRIISVSRRTDIPAFYGDWFMNRIRAGFAGHVNPFGGQKYRVDLRPEAVMCLAFWSKNYAPFLGHLKTLDAMGYRSYFNFTITGLPTEFECNLVPAEEAVATLQRLAGQYSPRHIGWRYDPILISDRTPVEWHLERFAWLASRLRGATERCYFSFAIQYGKVQRNFEAFQRRRRLRITDPDLETRRRLAEQLAGIGAANGMTLYSCCGDVLVDGRILKAHCVDGDIIRRLFDPQGTVFTQVPTRKECGCAKSTDLGAYDTCPHGCVYCYANINKDQAMKRHASHDPASAFLGYTAAESDGWLAELPEPAVAARPAEAQMSLF
jgi:hypothetical protein